jgi:hypothetical protein
LFYSSSIWTLYRVHVRKHAAENGRHIIVVIVFDVSQIGQRRLCREGLRLRQQRVNQQSTVSVDQKRVGGRRLLEVLNLAEKGINGNVDARNATQRAV